MNKSEFEQQLKSLRNDIDDIDAQLVKLLNQRRAITTKVGELKSEIGMPIYAPAREESLISERRDQAIDIGVCPDLIEDVLRRLIRESYISQDESGYQCVNADCNKIVIIGGAGQLGAIFVDLFQRSGYRVDILEKLIGPIVTKYWLMPVWL